MVEPRLDLIENTGNWNGKISAQPLGGPGGPLIRSCERCVRVGTSLAAPVFLGRRSSGLANGSPTLDPSV